MANDGLGPFFTSRSRPGMFGRRQDVEEPEEERQQEREKKLSFLDRFAQVFTGPNDPRLSDEQNAQVRDQSLVQAGLAIMAAGGRTGLDRASLLTALAEGAGAGRTAGATGRRGQVIGGLAGQEPNVALPQFRQMFIEAVQSGDADAARSIATIINAMEASASKAGEQSSIIWRTVGRFIIGIDPITGQEISRIETPKDASGKPEVVVDPETGQRTLALWRPDQNAYFTLDGREIVGAQPRENVPAATASDKEGQLSSLEFGISFLREHGRPNPAEGLYPGSEWFAQTEPLVLILTRLYQGGRPTDKDIELSRRVFIPRFYDTNAAIEAKLDAMDRALAAFREGRPAPAYGELGQGVDPASLVPGADGQASESSTPLRERGRNSRRNQ
jgi:hypothetical protein